MQIHLAIAKGRVSFRVFTQVDGIISVRIFESLIAAFLLFSPPQSRSLEPSTQETCLTAWLLPENRNAKSDIVQQPSSTQLYMCLTPTMPATSMLSYDYCKLALSNIILAILYSTMATKPALLCLTLMEVSTLAKSGLATRLFLTGSAPVQDNGGSMR